MSAPQASLPLGDAKTLPTTQLIHGDCLEVMPTLPANSVEMIFADLPYATKGRQVTANAWDVALDLTMFWRGANHILPERAWALFTADLPHAATLHASNRKSYRHDIIWHKLGRLSGFLHARHAPLRAHEVVLCFAKKQGTFNPQMTEGKPHNRHLYVSPHAHGANFHRFKQKVAENKGTRYPTSVLALHRVTGKQLHPTEKPIAVLEWLIRTYTNEGDTVLDPTAGSGTTAVAALRTGRHSICIEKDAGYYEVMCKRVAEERDRLETQS